MSELEAGTRDVLVVVHPGSACGSADYNIGRFEARAARDALVTALKTWHGGVLVIDGELSDELPDFPALNGAIDVALSQARDRGHTSLRVVGDDPDQVKRISEFVKKGGSAVREFQYEVTGAWYHPEDGSGCVGSVITQLQKMGCKARVHESAVELSMDDDPEPSRAPRP